MKLSIWTLAAVAWVAYVFAMGDALFGLVVIAWPAFIGLLGAYGRGEIIK